jgi:hypothetical protein
MISYAEPVAGQNLYERPNNDAPTARFAYSGLTCRLKKQASGGKKA